MKSIIASITFAFCVVSLYGQTTKFHLTGGNLNIQGNTSVILDNTKWINDGDFDAGTGKVQFVGDAATTETTIEGNTVTTFYTVEINKSLNSVELSKEVIIQNKLDLVNGSLFLKDYHLSLNTTASVNNATTQNFIQTNGIGEVQQLIQNGSSVTYPVGNDSYTPLTIQNNGIVDLFMVRVDNQLLKEGTTGTPIASDVVGKSWIVREEVTGGNTVDLTFNWHSGDELLGFDPTNCFVTNFQNGIWQNFPTQNAVGSNPYSVTQMGISSFSTFGIASNAAVLPVELLYFMGEKVSEGVRLDWKTVSEINNKGFEIEVSRQPKNGVLLNEMEWTTLDFVEGYGTTTTPQTYEYLDRFPEIGINYYRLKQIDYDGAYQYTNAIAIEYEEVSKLTFEIYPNPAVDYVTVASTTTDILTDFTVILYDGKGQALQLQKGQQQVKMDVRQLPEAVYFFQIRSGTYQEIKKIMVKR